MTHDGLPSRGSEQAKPVRFVLTPYRSLSRPGFLVLIGAIGLVSFVTGVVFAMLGAWRSVRTFPFPSFTGSGQRHAQGA